MAREFTVSWSGSMAVTADTPEEAARLVQQHRDLAHTVQICTDVVGVEETLRGENGQVSGYRSIPREEWKTAR